MANVGVHARPQALVVVPIMPSDRGNGLAIRAGFFLDTYAKRFDIDLAIIPIAGGPAELSPFVIPRTRRASVLPVPTLNTHFALIRGVADPEAQLSAFRQYGRPSIGSRLSAETERALLAFAGHTEYDLVHISRLYLASLAGPWTSGGHRPGRLVLDCDEDDASVYRRFAALHRKYGRARLAKWNDVEADAFKALGTQWLSRFDLVFVASTGEARLLGTRAFGAPIRVIPNLPPKGVTQPIGPCVQRRKILLVGNMGYMPNSDAAIWFATRIWPRLHRKMPSIQLVIAGGGMPHSVKKLVSRPGIIASGQVENLGPLYRSAALAVVPLRAGGGTRIKVLEAAAQGVPVVATRFGAAGTGFRSGRELLLADDESGIAAFCAKLLINGGLASRLVSQAKRKLRRDFCSRRCAARLLGTIEVPAV